MKKKIYKFINQFFLHSINTTRSSLENKATKLIYNTLQNAEQPFHQYKYSLWSMQTLAQRVTYHFVATVNTSNPQELLH